MALAIMCIQSYTVKRQEKGENSGTKAHYDTRKSLILTYFDFSENRLQSLISKMAQAKLDQFYDGLCFLW